MPLVQGATAQPGNSAGSSVAVNQSPSVAAGPRATVLQPPSIIAGGHAMTARVPSAIPWLHPTTDGVHAIAEGRQSIIAWVHSAVAWVHSTIHWLPSIIARRLAMAKRRQSAIIHVLFAKKPHFYQFNAKTQRSQDAESDISLRLHAFAPLR